MQVPMSVRRIRLMTVDAFSGWERADGASTEPAASQLT